MTDIVKRLRRDEKLGNDDAGEAADEIERLRHDLDRAMANHVADINWPACPKCGETDGGMATECLFQNGFSCGFAVERATDNPAVNE